MSDVKVSYFNITALGEPIRLLLTYAGTPFEDKRVEMGDWPELKPSMPFGQMPIYEEDGKMAHQSKAIARYLAKKSKLVGESDWENLEIDAVVDTIQDLLSKIGQWYYEEDPAVKESKKAVLDGETLPFYLPKLDAIAKENDGHLALKKLTWADFYFSGMLGYYIALVGADFTENYPNLTAVRENVFAIPSIRAWVDVHPQGLLMH